MSFFACSHIALTSTECECPRALTAIPAKVMVFVSFGIIKEYAPAMGKTYRNPVSESIHVVFLVFLNNFP